MDLLKMNLGYVNAYFAHTPSIYLAPRDRCCDVVTGAELGRRGNGAAVFLSSCSSKR